MRISDGKTAKSSGRLICIATSRISNEQVMLRPSSRSRKAAGSGTTSMRTIETTPTGTAILPMPFTSAPPAGASREVSRVRHRQGRARSVPVEEAGRGKGAGSGSRDPASSCLGEALGVRWLEAGPVEAAAYAACAQVHHERQHPGHRGEQLRRHLLADVAGGVQGPG